jgi:hypothetical protein
MPHILSFLLVLRAARLRSQTGASLSRKLLSGFEGSFTVMGHRGASAENFD